MAEKDTGYVVYIKGEPLEVEPEIVPIESDFGKILKEAERVAEELGLEEDKWDVITDDDRYIAMVEIGQKFEAFSTDNYLDYLDDYYVWDRVGKRWTDHFTWENRDESTQDKEDAMELLSIKMTEWIAGTLYEGDVEDMEAFAEKWKIPFSTELFGHFDYMFDRTYPNWNSSSAYC